MNMPCINNGYYKIKLNLDYFVLKKKNEMKETVTACIQHYNPICGPMDPSITELISTSSLSALFSRILAATTVAVLELGISKPQICYSKIDRADKVGTKRDSNYKLF